MTSSFLPQDDSKPLGGRGAPPLQPVVSRQQRVPTHPGVHYGIVYSPSPGSCFSPCSSPPPPPPPAHKPPSLENPAQLPTAVVSLYRIAPGKQLDFSPVDGRSCCDNTGAGEEAEWSIKPPYSLSTPTVTVGDYFHVVLLTPPTSSRPRWTQLLRCTGAAQGFSESSKTLNFAAWHNQPPSQLPLTSLIISASQNSSHRRSS